MFALSVRVMERSDTGTTIPCAVFTTRSEAIDFFQEQFGGLRHAHPVVVSCPCAGPSKGTCGVLASRHAAEAFCPHLADAPPTAD